MYRQSGEKTPISSKTYFEDRFGVAVVVVLVEVVVAKDLKQG